MIVALFALATALAFELWASFVHERLWHGPLWALHEPHHRPGNRALNSNDLLSGSHAPPAALLCFLGSLGMVVHGHPAFHAGFGVGVGATAFGLAYFLVHDGFIHGRLPLAGLRRVPYFERIRRAHLVHHGTNAEPYGMFAPTFAPRVSSTREEEPWNAPTQTPCSPASEPNSPPPRRPAP